MYIIYNQHMIQFHVLVLRIEVNVYDPPSFLRYLRGSEDHTQSFQSAVLIHEIHVMRSYIYRSTLSIYDRPS